MLAFIFIVCDEDIGLVMKRETAMTSFEEWFAYIQWFWGKESITCAALARPFGACKDTIGRVLEKQIEDGCSGASETAPCLRVSKKVLQCEVKSGTRDTMESASSCRTTQTSMHLVHRMPRQIGTGSATAMAAA